MDVESPDSMDVIVWHYTTEIENVGLAKSRR
jgi:hypothetical protein